MKKRILAIMLACFMIVSLLPMQAFAEETEAKCVGTGNHSVLNCEYEKVGEYGECGKWNYTVYRCLACEELFVDDIVENENAHDFEVIVEAVAPDCAEEEDGTVAVEKCALCGLTKGGETVEWAHDYEDAEVYGNCKDGWKHKCNVCGEEAAVTEDVSNTHLWDLLEIKTEPDEENLKNGLAVYGCSECGKTKEVVILHHDCLETEVTEATCTVAEHKECEICGRLYMEEDGEWVEVEEEDLAITNHKWVETIGTAKAKFALAAGVKTPFTAKYEGEFTFEAPADMYLFDAEGNQIGGMRSKGTQVSREMEAGETIYFLTFVKVENMPILCEYAVEETEGDCKNPSTETSFCVICQSEQTNVGKMGHDSTWVDIVDATCTTYGYSVYACTLCGFYEEIVQTEPLNHEGDWDMITVDPVDCKPGKIYFHCDLCNKDIDVAEIPAEEEHDFDVAVPEEVPTCTEAGVGTQECKVCGFKLEDVVIPATGHTKPATCNPDHVEATCTKDGYNDFVCTTCGEWVTGVVEAAGHDILTRYEIDCGTVTVSSWCTVCGAQFGEKTTTEETAAFFDSYDEAKAGHGRYDYAVDAEGNYYEFDGTNWVEVEEPSYTSVLATAGTTKHVEPTCTTDGVYSKRCKTCGFDVFFTKPATGHEKETNAVDVVDLSIKAWSSYFTVKGLGTTEYTFAEGSTLAEELKGLPVNFFGWVKGTVKMVVTYHNSAVKPQTITASVEAGKHYKDAEGYKEVTLTFAAIKSITVTYIVDGIEIDGSEDISEPGCYGYNYTAAWVCSICGKAEAAVEEYIWHTGENVVFVEGADATCTEDGMTEWDYCEDCYFVGLEESLVITAPGHSHVKVDDVLDHEIDFSYDHYVCFCGDEYIINYVPACEHEYVASTIVNKCDDVVYTCKFCFDSYVEEGTHMNAAGEVITDDCYNTAEDRECVFCEEEIGATEHEMELVKTEAATCLNYAYNVYVCVNCDHVETEVIGDELGDHTWSEEEEIVLEGAEEEEIHTGIFVKGCVICGEIYKRGGDVNFELSIDEEATFVATSTIDVELTLSTEYIAMWGFDVDVVYNPELVKFVGFTFKSETLNNTYRVNDNLKAIYDIGDKNENGEEEFLRFETPYVSILANAAGDVVVDEEVVVVLHFEALEVEEAEEAVFTLLVNSVLGVDGYNRYVVNGDEQEITAVIDLLMDIDGDGFITLADALAVYNIVTGEYVYDARGDVDYDGEITLADFMAIYEYLAN